MTSFLSTPSARRATTPCCRISLTKEISIHALREEGDGSVLYDLFLALGFLSTPSARRATSAAKSDAFDIEISIHALREEGDSPATTPTSRFIRFLSTPSARRATLYIPYYNAAGEISIHALREEGDGSSPINFHAYRGFLSTPSARRATFRAVDVRAFCNFYPRPPRGGRRKFYPSISHDVLFLSTPSARRATPALPLAPAPRLISIHALREEGDISFDTAVGDLSYFYPRPPRGGRP